jgi:Xaa-Pro aminopeptidase
MNEKTTQILDLVKELTILELADLVKALEEEFGVSAAPVAVAGAVAPGAAAPAAEEKTEFDVVLTEAGASKLIDGLREFKDADEIETIAKAQDLADAAFEHIIKVMTPNMTEIEVALELEFFMRKNGAKATSFETIAVSGSASSLPHGVPRNVKLQAGFLTMDYGALYGGYCSDMTRTVVIGKADSDIKKVYDTVLEAQTRALDAAANGERGCFKLDKIARDVIENAGYKGCFGHSLGHGVGMYIHEAPRLSFAVAQDKRLEVGNVVTFEPGIYIPGKYGCRIEDMAAITESGIYNFTKSKKELIEL